MYAYLKFLCVWNVAVSLSVVYKHSVFIPYFAQSASGLAPKAPKDQAIKTQPLQTTNQLALF